MAARRVGLSQHRKSAGYNQEKLAELLGVERSTVVRWERAETDPQPWIRPKLARALKVTPEELRTLLDDVTVPQAQPGERMRYVLEHPSQVDLVAVASLHEHIRQVDEQYHTVPSTALLSSAGQLHGQVRFLRENAANPRVRKALLEVEAESATIMSQLVWDVSQRRDHAAPLAYLDEAIEAARQARDASTEAYATLRKSYLALYGETSPEHGAILAAGAAEIANPVSPALTGLSLLHVAEGRAMLGDHAACEHALAKAEAQFDRPSTDDVAAEYYTRTEFHRLAGSCYLFLGQPERAEPLLRTTAHALTERKKSQAIAYGNLTLALIRQHKLDEAATTMHRTIDAVELTRGGGGLNLAFTAGQELRPWRHESWVHDVQDRLLALMAAI
ncbi:DNA-binding XRE family transcriptional regulator [Lipingzhangella halophila]|uniref:DNA-binding XRE family transcriptional regulator n=1 Tax=Lipingzhangella halophila TaxID=1783352 RepID=A0A7W7RE88_9ACTN|nr:helix-turn-helix transcriptional regulator [Lipingzhangella halophila]MBB4930378.1 DNA-binding XRE family transcriptional regulator [Lipingzhangella halophila]